MRGQKTTSGTDRRHQWARDRDQGKVHAADASVRIAEAAPSCLVCGQGQRGRILRTRYQDLPHCQRCWFVFGWPVFSRESLLDYGEISFRGGGFPETAEFFDCRRVGRNGSALLKQHQRGLERISRVVPREDFWTSAVARPSSSTLPAPPATPWRESDPAPEAARIVRSDFGLPVRAASFSPTSASGHRARSMRPWSGQGSLPSRGVWIAPTWSRYRLKTSVRTGLIAIGRLTRFRSRLWILARAAA